MTKSIKPKEKRETKTKQLAENFNEALDEATKTGEIVSVVDKPLVPNDYKTKLTKAQVDLIKTTIAKGASDDELKMFLYVCERTRLDPFTKQIHLVPRWDSRIGKEIRTPIVGIDGLRSIAERTNEYAGNDDPTFDDEVTPKKATVTVYKIVQGVRSPFTASARLDQYFPGEKQGFMWKKMPHLMLGKCAEALALRKAFPAVMSGLYVVEEIQQAQLPATATTAPTEGNYDKATKIINQMTNIDGLKETKTKILNSPKYTKEEKAKIDELIVTRINTLEKDATPNVPPTQHAKDAGNEPSEL